MGDLMRSTQTKDCPLARDNHVWLTGQADFHADLPYRQSSIKLFCQYFAHWTSLVLSFGQPVLILYLPNGQVAQKVSVEP
jgi:hypothetical protein